MNTFTRISLWCLFLIAPAFLFAQNALVGSGFTSGWGSACTNANNYEYYASSAGTSYIKTDNANGTGDQYFRMGVDWGGSYKQLTITPGSDTQINPETGYTLNGSCTGSGALYITVSSTSDNYVFKTKDAGSSPTGDFIYFRVQGAVQTISSVALSSTAVQVGQSATITATMSGSPSALATGQGVYLRYSDDNFSTSTVAEMSFGGGVYAATIPASMNNSTGKTVKYYVFSSGDGMTISSANADFYTINLDNNSGTNYSYTVSAYETKAIGNWNTASTWVDNLIPDSYDHDVVIKSGHVVEIDLNAKVKTITIESGATLNGGVSGPNTLSIATNGSFTNNGAYIPVQDILFFTSDGTFTSAVVTNYGAVTIDGLVSFSTNITVDILLINTGGAVTNNPPTYGGVAKILTYNTGGTYGRGLEWSELSGAGYPENVLITGNTGLNLGNGATNITRKISGNLQIDAGSALYMDFGTDDMDQDLVVSGNVILNGSISLSDVSGGDLTIDGDLTMNTGASLVTKNRAVLFASTGNHNINGTIANITFDYLWIWDNNDLTLHLPIILDDAMTIMPNCTLFTQSNTVFMNSADINMLTGSLVDGGTGLFDFDGGSTLSNAGTAKYEFNDVEIGSSSPGVDFGTASTINGTLEILPGGFVKTGGAPKYGTSSLLKYNYNSNTYYSFNEWLSTTPGSQGYPYKVEITGNTELALGANGGTASAFEAGGSLTIGAGSSLNMNKAGNVMTKAVTILGNIDNSGSLILSGSVGGDFVLHGDWTSSGTFTPNDREVTFNTSSNDIDINSATTFDYLRINGTNQVNIQNVDISAEERAVVETGATLSTSDQLFLGDGASLLHGTGTPGGGGVVTGKITSNRSVGSNWTYYGSPVVGANTSAIGSTVYFFDPTTPASAGSISDLQTGWKTVSGAMTSGVGYIARNGNTKSFFGNAGNANSPITVPVVTPGNGVKWNFIGNPFPSGIDAQEFIDDNGPNGLGLISGSIYLWDDPQANGRSQSDFMVWNAAGVAAGSQIGGANGGPGPILGPNSGGLFSGNIASGQGFFVEATTAGNVQFQNDQRNDQNDAFFRKAPIDRLWVSVINGANNYTEALIAFIDGATDQRDLLYDAIKLEGNDELGIYSKLQQGKYSIQAYPLLTSSRIVDLGVQVGISGTHTINLERIENIDETVMIWLEDIQEGVLHNLRLSEYQINMSKGIYENRFRIHFSPALISSTVDASCDDKDGIISLNQPGLTTWNLEIMDAAGQTVHSASSINGQYDVSGLSNGLYDMVLTAADGYTVNKQVLVNGLPVVQSQFGMSNARIFVGESIEFNNFSSGNGLSTWDMGNGTIISNETHPLYTYTNPGEYTVTLTTSNLYCQHSISKLVVVSDNKTTGIADLEDASDYSIHNLDNTIQITFNSSILDDKSIKVYNSLGQNMGIEQNKLESNSVQLDLSHFEKGVYMLEISYNDSRSVEKIMIR